MTLGSIFDATFTVRADIFILVMSVIWLFLGWIAISLWRERREYRQQRIRDAGWDQQYGLIKVTDNGDHITANFTVVGDEHPISDNPVPEVWHTSPFKKGRRTS